MNIEQQHLNFQSDYVKTDYYKIHYEKTNAANSAFSWNKEANRYTWHDVNSAWEMWLAAQQQEGYVMAPVEPSLETMQKMNREFIDSEFETPKYRMQQVYKAMIKASSQ